MFSVLISVYANDRPDWFDEAMASIWDRQTVRPEQIVLVQDGPVGPGLEDRIAGWVRRLGQQLVVVPLPVNGGLASALNEGLRHCSHPLVARMDADDISEPQRFEWQLQEFMSFPEIDVLSGTITECDEGKRVHGIRQLPLGHRELRAFAQSRSPASHPAVMFRREAVLSVGGYPPFRKAQDYALWGTLMKAGFQFKNLPQPLLMMRTDWQKANKRGAAHFREERNVFRYLRQIRFLSVSSYWWLLGSRWTLRRLPPSIQRLLYRNFR